MAKLQPPLSCSWGQLIQLWVQSFRCCFSLHAETRNFFHHSRWFIPAKRKQIAEQLMNEMEKLLEAMTKWLQDLDLEVNEAKTEVCLFFKCDVVWILINMWNTKINSKLMWNILGVIFHTKLCWALHVSNSIKR
jgi:hypothetical protein